jgi:hypothetical protein
LMIGSHGDSKFGPRTPISSRRCSTLSGPSWANRDRPLARASLAGYTRRKHGDFVDIRSAG